MHLSDWARWQEAIGGIYFTKKWRAENLQPGLVFDNFKPRLKSGIFNCISWLNGSFFGGYERGVLKELNQDLFIMAHICCSFTSWDYWYIISLLQSNRRKLFRDYMRTTNIDQVLHYFYIAHPKKFHISSLHICVPCSSLTAAAFAQASALDSSANEIRPLFLGAKHEWSKSKSYVVNT